MHSLYFIIVIFLNYLQLTTSANYGDAIRKVGCYNSPCGIWSVDNLPWLAIIEHVDYNNLRSRKSLSKGVLIDNRHILTTVSSLYSSPSNWTVSAVRLADSVTWLSSKFIGNRLETQIIPIEKTYQHPNKDIAILKLTRTINFTKYIQPICFSDSPQANFNYRDVYGHTCKRFFNTRGQSYKSAKLFTAYPIATPQDCIIMFDRKNANITDEEFCAWDNPGDNCAAEIGSPLMAKVQPYKFVLIGLNSRTIKSDLYDEYDYPGIYVNVGSHIEWIRQIVKCSF